MKRSPTDKIYPVNGIATLIQALEAEGVSNIDAMSKLELTPKELHCPSTRVSLNQIIQSYRNAMRYSADPNFAYHLGLRFHVSTYRMYGFAVLSGTDFRQTARFAEQYHKLMISDAVIGFEEKDAYAIWTIVPVALPSIDSQLYRFIVELYFGVVISLSRDVMGPTFMPRELWVTYGSAHERETPTNIFGCPVLFSQNKNALALNKEWLDGPAHFGNKITFQEASELCDHLIEEMHFRIGISGSVREALLANLANPLGFEDLAKRLRISARTLKRKLSVEGTSYRKIVDELRAHVAVKLLRDTELAIVDVASQLGFSDPRNFREAFRRWTMETPSEFRHRVVNG